MQSFPLFFKIRAATFTVVMLFSFLWLALLSVEVFARWTMSDEISQSLMLLFLLTNTITLISLPILILVKFRAWLDAARLLLLFVLQVGSAAAGTYWSPRIECPNQTPDDISVCRLIGVYTMLACWIIPALLLGYSTYFALVVYLQSRIPVIVEPKHPSGVDTEIGSTDSPSLWKEMMKEVVGIQASTIDRGAQPCSPMLPTMVRTGQSSPPRPSASEPRSMLPTAPRRQSTMPSLPHAGQWHLPTPHPAPSRHHSLPAFKHGNGPLIHPVPPHPTIVTSPSLPQTPSSYAHSYSYSIPSPANPRSLKFMPGRTVVQSSSHDNRWRSRHLSIIPSTSSLPEMQFPGESPTSHSGRARLSKPFPIHLL